LKKKRSVVMRLLRTLDRLTGFWRDAKGAIAVEFAVVAPVLVALMVGTFEVTRYVLLHQKLDRMAVAASDLVSQGETITAAQLADIFTATGLIAEPFTIGADGVVIISSIYRVAGVTTIRWQRSGTGSMSAGSRVGAEGAAPNFPAGFVLKDGESVIFAEVFYQFRPMFAPDLVPASTLYHRAIFRPRRGTLDTITP
jgi:Flp pilus assembly pilin Flp